MTLMGGPIDARRSPTEVNKLAEKRASTGSAATACMTVPFPYPGFGREVYPGFLQLSSFMSMNIDRHVSAHLDVQPPVRGDGDSAEKHREFYDEYLSVMDLTAEFYLQTVETVFARHLLPKGEMTHRGAPVDPTRSATSALLTVEGENDDISGVGQTQAAHDLCANIPDAQEAPLPAAEGRPLRRLQRLPLPRRDCAAHPRLHRRNRRRRQVAQAEDQRRTAPGPRLAHDVLIVDSSSRGAKRRGDPWNARRPRSLDCFADEPDAPPGRGKTRKAEAASQRARSICGRQLRVSANLRHAKGPAARAAPLSRSVADIRTRECRKPRRRRAPFPCGP